jgi:levanase
MDSAQGETWSPAFAPSFGDHLAFLVGGGSAANVGVELLVSGGVVKSWHGQDSDVLGFSALDLTPYAGAQCQLHVYDHATGPWGHVLADHFMLLH